MRLMVSVDHMGRTGKRTGDRGASHGRTFEVDLTWRIAEGIYRAARDRVDVIIATHGDYSQRHEWANRERVDVYLALHINASTSPTADYGAFFYHPATSPGNGDRLAGLMATGMMDLARRGVIQADGRTRARARGYTARAISAAGQTWRNPRYTIAGLRRPVGICCEPWFISSPANRALWCNTGALLEVGRVYLDACERWHQTKSPGGTS